MEYIANLVNIYTADSTEEANFEDMVM